MTKEEKPIVYKAINLLEMYKEDTSKDYLKEHIEEVLSQLRLIAK